MQEVKTYGYAEQPKTYLQEAKLLAAVIGNPYAIGDVSKIVCEKDFADPINAKCWVWLYQTYLEGGEIDEAKAMQNYGNKNYFLDHIMPDAIQTGIMDVMEKAGMLREASNRNKLYQLAVHLMNASRGTTPLAECNSQMEAYITESRKVYTSDAKIAADVINDLGQEISKDKQDKAEGKRLRIPTSFEMLDFITYGGFAPCNLVILAARPSVGKTAIALQMAMGCAANKIPCHFFSLEMSNTELARRMLASTDKVSPAELSNGTVEWQNFEAAAGTFTSGYPLWMNDTAASLNELCAKISMAHRQGNCEVAYIDYLGLIDFGEDKRTYYTQITEATKRLKRLAKECHIPIVLLCQLNRDCVREGGKVRAPELHDLRDSGSIEQDADIVLMCDRLPEKTDAQRMCDGEILRARNVIRMFVRKNRQGKSGNCMFLAASEAYATFTEVNNPDDLTKQQITKPSRAIPAPYAIESADNKEDDNLPF